MFQPLPDLSQVFDLYVQCRSKEVNSSYKSKKGVDSRVNTDIDATYDDSLVNASLAYKI